MSNKLSVGDYIVFGVSLVVPVAIALYYACVKKQKTTSAMFLGDRTLSAFPVSFSLAVSYLSAVTITGIPGEIAYHGWLFPWTWLLASTFSLLLVGNLFIPIFYKMRLTSVYEYLELRYNSRLVRLLATFSYMASILLYMGVVLYAPCLALHTVTGLSVVFLILLGGIVATIYTVMGGLKTVVWTDLFQGIMMLGGLGAIIGRGTYLAGGFERVWEIGVATQRVEWANWDPSPFARNTTLGIFCGQFVLWGAIFGCHQTQVQRYCATRSLRQARWALLLSVLVIWLVVGCAVIAGLVVYANYWSCDPKAERIITKKDELVTQFVLDHLSFYGVPGLFIASLLSGALSTLSSGLNSLAAAIWEDLVKPMSWATVITEGRQVFLTRAIATFMGLVTIGLAVITARLDGVLQLGNTAMGVLAGPLLAVFMLGFFTTTANKMGAVCGIICGNAFTVWLLVGSLLYKPPPGPSTALTTYIDGCNSNNTLLLDVHAIVHSHSLRPKVFFYIPDGDWQTVLYSTSYHLYALSGFLICLIVCLVVSLISRLCMSNPKPVEPLLLHPLVRSGGACNCSGTIRSETYHNHSKALVNPRSGQPYLGRHYGGNSGRNLHDRHALEDWDDTHYRWPSPSLPPTLKKNGGHNHPVKHEHNNNNEFYARRHKMALDPFGTLDKTNINLADRISMDSTNVQVHKQSFHVNYAYSGSNSPDVRAKHDNNSSDEEEQILDEFGDVVKVRRRDKGAVSASISNKSDNNSNENAEQDNSSEDGWTTEF